MGRKGNWFTNVKKALSTDSSKDNKEERSSKSKKKWFGKQKNPSSDGSDATTSRAMEPPNAATWTPTENVIVEMDDHHHNRRSPVAAVPTVAPPPEIRAVTDEIVVVQTTTKVSRFVGRSGEEAAAVHIQTAFRGYLARRALRALRGLVRLKLLMEGSVVKRQATNTLKCMQTLSRVQSQIRSRRIRMLEENQALQRQILQKHATDLDNLRLGEEWDDSLQSKEQIEASLLNKYEASVRRERAMAYAFSHQQTLKNPTRSATPMFMDPRNPTWGWSWLERWMAARPWETNKDNINTKDKETESKRSIIVGGEINKSYARYLLNSEKLSSPTAAAAPQKPPSAFHSPATPTRPSPSPGTKRANKSASPRVRGPEDDVKSVQSERPNRRHSMGSGSVVGGDDESLASSPSLPSYMVPTESARAKSRLNSPNNGIGSSQSQNQNQTESVKKRLSFPQSPGPGKPRRHSGPPKIDSASVAAVSENNESIGGGGAISVA